MVFLGIDPGYATIGFSILKKENNIFTVLDYGVITTDATLDFGQRLCQLAEDFLEIVEKYYPEMVAMEKLFWGENVDNAIRVAEARGVMEYIIAKKGIALKEYAPTEIKSRLVGHGKAQKFQVQNIIKMRLQLSEIPKPDDAADALAIALVCAEEYRN
jgi:crossover junction endodeoxyribonuclease RuvC